MRNNNATILMIDRRKESETRILLQVTSGLNRILSKKIYFYRIYNYGNQTYQINRSKPVVNYFFMANSIFYVMSTNEVYP